MIENVLEIKETQVREVMTPLVDVVAIDATASLVDFQILWTKHPYSRYEQRLWLYIECDFSFSNVITGL